MRDRSLSLFASSRKGKFSTICKEEASVAVAAAAAAVGVGSCCCAVPEMYAQLRVCGAVLPFSHETDLERVEGNILNASCSDRVVVKDDEKKRVAGKGCVVGWFVMW